MICQVAPRKDLRWAAKDPNKGFWIEGKDRADCIKQLQEWANAHPEKWIYYYDCGMRPSYPVPVARQLFEVSIYDEEPASLMLFSRLFQKGCENKKEIDMMSSEERNALYEKQLLFFAMLGHYARGGK